MAPLNTAKLKEIYLEAEGDVSCGGHGVGLMAVANYVLDMAAIACEDWGSEKVDKWAGTELEDDAKSRAWDSLMCAHAVRALKP